MFTQILPLLFAPLVLSSPLSGLFTRQTTCYKGVYVIGARGSLEKAGFGSVASVVSGVVSAIPNSGSIALNYPAAVFDPIYPESVSDGVTAMITVIKNYVDKCSGKVVIVGFSQGGQVVTTVLAGGSGQPAPIPAKYAAFISAAVAFGDPTFTHGQSFNAGTDKTTDGIFGRDEGSADLALLNTYSAKVRSYCNTGDVYCASGSSSGVHGMEVSTWRTDAINFIVKVST